MSVWNSPDIVSNFRTANPSQTLLAFARFFAGTLTGADRTETDKPASDSGTAHNRRTSVDSAPETPSRTLEILDIGCGAGRNTIPLAAEGHRVVGIDIAPAMVEAAQASAEQQLVDERCTFLTGRMDALPLADDRKFDLVVSHGVWNLAETEAIFRAALREAQRTAVSGTALFVTTFSRNTLPPSAVPVAGSTYIFTDFNETPQCFLRREELVGELDAVGFRPWPGREIRELNRPAPWEQRGSAGPAARQGEHRTSHDGLSGSRSSRTRALSIATPKRPVLYEGIWVQR